MFVGAAGVGAVVLHVRTLVEHVRHGRPVPGVRARVARHAVPGLLALEPARGLVQGPSAGG
jgi:hypothetical protein